MPPFGSDSDSTWIRLGFDSDSELLLRAFWVPELRLGEDSPCDDQSV